MNIPSRAILVLCACGVVTSLCAEATAQSRVRIDWVQRYNGPGSGTDWAWALAVDDSGNVYVTGSPVTIKYSPTGDSIWVGADPGNAVAIDDSGNVYVVGGHTVKYTPSGDTLWVGGLGGGDVAIDDSGNVYVTGTSEGDYTTVKYSPTGDTIWTNRYEGPRDDSLRDAVRDLAIDASGNVYVTGESYDGNNPDYTTIKYSPSGDTLWLRRYNRPPNAWDAASALAVDASGNVYVTGKSAYSDPFNEDWNYVTIKYSPNGDTVWARLFSGSGGRDVAVDASGNVYVTGMGFNTIKYTPTGDTLWVRSYIGPWNRGGYANALAVDASGNVYVTGHCVGGSLQDYATVKYSPTGAELWVRRYNGPGYVEDFARAVALDESGNVYVTGTSAGDYATIKYVSCSIDVTGDVTADGTITSADIIYLVNYVFKGGTAPLPCEASGDVDCSGVCVSSDIIYLVNHVFKGDAPPCDACNSSLASACP